MKKKKTIDIFNFVAPVSAEMFEEDSNISDVEVLRVGTIQDRGWKITEKMLQQYVENYKDDVYGTDIQVNLEHMRGSEAAGWVKDLFVEKRKLYAKVEWTELGVEKIKKKLYRFVSAELANTYPHHKTGEEVQNVFIGLALTNTPALKAQKPLILSEDLNNLINQTNHMFEKLLQKLKEREIVSKEDKKMLRELLEEVPAEEKEAAEAGVAEVEAKPEEPAKSEEEKKEEEAKAAKQQELAEKAKNADKLAEELKDRDARIAKLEEKNTRAELSEKLNKEFKLSESTFTGLSEKGVDLAVDFLVKLSEEQREKFYALLKEVKHVDLSERGKSGTGSHESLNDKAQDDKDRAEAEKMSKENGRSVSENLAEIYSKRDQEV